VCVAVSPLDGTITFELNDRPLSSIGRFGMGVHFTLTLSRSGQVRR